jgi:hypothetical protein
MFCEHATMYVHPLPYIDHRSLRAALAEQRTKLQNAGHRHEQDDRLFAYLEWATEAASQLSSFLRPQSVSDLIHTRRYEHLLMAGHGLIGGRTSQHRVLNGLINAEVADRIAIFERAGYLLEQRIGRWSDSSLLIVADTNFYMQHEKRFDEVDFFDLLLTEDRLAPGEHIHLILPILVVDELDSQKRRSEIDKRSRARQTLAVIDRLFEDPHACPRIASGAGSSGAGIVTMELLPDPPNHIRLPRADDELVDRIVSEQPVAARAITLLTYDSGAATRGRLARLVVKKLVESEAPERPEKRVRDRGSMYPGRPTPAPT